MGGGRDGGREGEREGGGERYSHITIPLLHIHYGNVPQNCLDFKL